MLAQRIRVKQNKIPGRKVFVVHKAKIIYKSVQPPLLYDVLVCVAALSKKVKENCKTKGKGCGMFYSIYQQGNPQQLE